MGRDVIIACDFDSAEKTFAFLDKFTEEKPFVWLVNNGRYYVETGNTAAGGLIRIDNRIDGLAEYAEKLDAKYTELCASQKNLRTAIDNSVSYAGDIERCRALVEKYDKELGVDKE